MVASKRQRHPDHFPGPRYKEHLCTVILLLLCMGCVCMWLCVGLGVQVVGGVHAKEKRRSPAASRWTIA